jgi:hypothetical protein
MTQTLSPTSRRADPLLDADYRPLPGSPCLGAASDGGDVGAVQTEPPAVDWQAKYEAVVVRYNTVVAERNAAMVEMERYRDWYNELYAQWRQIATFLGGPDDEDVLKFFGEYRAEYNAFLAERDAALAEITRLRGYLTRAGAEVMAALEPVL